MKPFGVMLNETDTFHIGHSMQTDPQTAFRALSDPTRRDILAILREGDATIGQVAGRFRMTRPAVRKHLSILEDSHLIEVIPRGRARVNRLRPEGFEPVVSWLAALDIAWDDRLSALKSAIESHVSTKGTTDEDNS